jgi:hypothetical protein
MIVFLRDVYLCLGRSDNRRSNNHPENGKEKFHRSGAIGPVRCCPRPCSVKRMSGLREVAVKDQRTGKIFLLDDLA